MRNLVVGTAGHIDHGKTTLVKALTGIDTDRLKEEKEKGISIDIGFATLKLPSGQILDIIDVPGHEKLIRNMLRGIWGVDIALLVVAADDGPMPQTREHLDILRLLEIKYGLMVISKIDLVDDELLELATEEVTQLVKGTFLENAPLIYFSSKDGRGITEIKHALDEIARRVNEKERDKAFRLPIDRVFIMPGHGTVVTGTIASGRIKEGDEVEIYPLGFKVKARSIQIRRRRVSEATAGQRVGVNLPNVKVEELERGMILAEVGSLIPTHLINARLHYLESNSEPLYRRQRVKFYSGTSEAVARVILMNSEKLLPGESALVQFRLEKKLVPVPFDKYIVRSLSPISTIGGGMILETNCRKYRRYDPDTIKQLEVFEKGEHEEIVDLLVKKSKYQPLKPNEISQKSGLNRSGAKRVIDILLQRGILRINGAAIHKEWYEDLIQRELPTCKGGDESSFLHLPVR